MAGSIQLSLLIGPGMPVPALAETSAVNVTNWPKTGVVTLVMTVVVVMATAVRTTSLPSPPA